MRCCNNRKFLLRKCLFRRCKLFCIIPLFLFGTVHPLTRWSSVQFVPDADLLGGGSVVLSAQGYYYEDITDGARIFPLGFVNYGIIEWVNIEAGYAGGPSLGLKARILGETRPWMPSLAIGVRNIFSHREAYLFDREPDSISNDFYAVCAKSFEAARLRFHIGVQSIPNNNDEKMSPFAALEKYFGMGMYVSIEAFFREKEIHPSVFASWRFWKKRCELSTGVIDITGMFVDRNDVPPNSAFYASSSSGFVRSGIWLGLRFNTSLKIGKSGGFTGIENSLSDHSASIHTLRDEVDSLKQLLKRSSGSIEALNKSFLQITDSSQTDEQRYRSLAINKLALLGSLYAAEPFEPDAVNNAMAELITNRDRMLPALYEIIVDPVKENRLRTLAIAALGEIGTPAASDVVIGFLGQSTIPELTIECLIALGKMKETRAVYLMQQLSNDPNDDVAFTAAEVLQKLEKETGISIVAIPKARFAPVSIPEKSIGGEDKPPSGKNVPGIDTQPQNIPSNAENGVDIGKIEKPDFVESTVSKDPKVATEKESVPTPEEKSVSYPIPPASTPPTIGSPQEKETAVAAPASDSTLVNKPQTLQDTVAEGKEKPVPPTTKKTKVKNPKKTTFEKKNRIDTSGDSW